MPKVSSSAVEEVDYAPSARVLDIKYKGGERYSYLKVPRREYEALLAAPSIGAFVNQRIKPNYAFRRGPAGQRNGRRK